MSDHAAHHTHKDYTFLTDETAKAHTMHDIVAHFVGSTEQGVKSAMTRKKITETKDFIHDEKKGWIPKPPDV